MRALVFTDLHLHRWSDFAVPTADGGNSRLDDGLSVFKKVGDIAMEEQVDLVVFNGDLFHRRGLIDTHVFNQAFVEVSKLAARFDGYSIRIVFIAGNHDQASRVSGVSSTAIYALSSIPGVTVHLSTAIDREHELGFIPYMEDTKELTKAFKSLSKCRVIFFHGGINGAATGPLEYQPKEELSAEDLPTKPLIFCGHYHKRQQLRENVWYVGSPMQHCRGDAGDDEKGCVVVDTKTRKLKWHDFNFPKFITRTYPDVRGIKGNFVDVSFDMATTPLATVTELYSAARAMQASPIVSVNDKSSRKRIEVDATFDPQKLMSRYVKKFGAKLDANKLMTLGKQILGG